jgi:hypothetical protein
VKVFGLAARRNMSFSADTPRSSLSPADCRTLHKILEHVHIPSTSESTGASEQSESLLSFSAGEDASSDPGCEDEVQYGHGEETEEGYADEDNSMELSDDAEDELHVIGGDIEDDIVRSNSAANEGHDAFRAVQAELGMSMLGDRAESSAAFEACVHRGLL